MERLLAGPRIFLVVLLVSLVISFVHSAATFTPSNDVVVVHAAGGYTLYNATSNSNLSRGQALLDVFTSQNLLSGDSIYLKAKAYNIANNVILLTGPLNNIINVSLYGAGKFQTQIQSSNDSVSNDILEIGHNSTITDLGVIATAPTLQQLPFGSAPGSQDNFGNSIARNLYIDGSSDGVYMLGTSSGEVTFYNLTSYTKWDTVNINTNVTAYFFDANMFTTGNFGGSPSQARDIVTNGNDNAIYVVNSTLSVVAGTYRYGVDSNGGSVYFYGGNITVAPDSTSWSINAIGGYTVYVNSSFTYNTLSADGSISHLGNVGFGSYSYQRSPVSAPIVLSSTSLSVSGATISPGQTEVISTTWNGMESPYSANYLIYNSIGLCSSQLFTGINLASNAYAYQTSAGSCGTGSLTANIEISDNIIAQVTNSIAFTVGSTSIGGSGPSTQTVTLSDNLNTNGITSDVPVIMAYVRSSGLGTYLSETPYYQSDLPAEITLPGNQYVEFSFACNFIVGQTLHQYLGDVYGLGYVGCGTNDTVYSGQYEVLYSSTPITSTSTTTVTTAPTTSIASVTTVPNQGIGSTATSITSTLETTTSTESSIATTTFGQNNITSKGAGGQEAGLAGGFLGISSEGWAVVVVVLLILILTVYWLLNRRVPTGRKK